MQKTNKAKKWKIWIVLIWVAFLVAVSIGCYSFQKSNICEKAKTELISQAEIISRQFNSLVDANFYTRSLLQERRLSEIKAISFALEGYENIKDANDFLTDIVNTTEVKNLWIYDRDGNIIFKNGELPEDKLDSYTVSNILDTKSYAEIKDKYESNDRYLTTTYLLDDDKDSVMWGVKDRWLVYAKSPYSEELRDAVQFFDWERILQSISIGREGMILGISETPGYVLSYPDPAMNRKPVEDLNITLAGEKTAASADQLQNAFAQPGTITEISVDSDRYYATRVHTDNDFFLIMFPENNINKAAASENLLLMVLLAVLTGIGVLYVFCYSGHAPKQAQIKNEKRKIISIGNLKLFTILAIILALVISLYVETHLLYAQIFQYTSTTAEDVMQKKNDADKQLKEIQTYLHTGSLEKCRIAKCCIQYAASGKADRAYVSTLADCLGVSSLYVFDKQGKVSVTNAPYDGDMIDEESPLHPVLEGTESVVVHSDQEEASIEEQQEIGVTMIDAGHRVAGAVVLKDITQSLLSDDLIFEAVFQRVFLKDNTVVMAVNSEDMTVQYFAQVNGSLLVSDRISFDYTEANVAELGVDEKLIRDYYNGEMFAIDNQYFASIRRNDNSFFMVLRPLVLIDAGNLLIVAFVGVAAALFFLFLICMTRKINKAEDFDAEVDQTKEKPEPNRSMENTEESMEKDDILTLLGNLAYRKKPLFEERWPSDGKKWKDKSAKERFSTASKLICIFVLIGIAVHALIERNNSIWYYCFSGEWRSGVNLYSITTCIIWIILLVIIYQIIHKVLYLIARAARRRGESICHLLNSFLGYVLFIAGVFIILGTLGVNVAVMSLSAGVAGVIFGIGCQNTVADILAGIFMVFEGSACAGDFISYNGKIGVIQTIGVRTTRIKWYGEITVVKNNEFKDYICMPANEIYRFVINLLVDIKEPLSRVENIINQDLPMMRDNLREAIKDTVTLEYSGVKSIEQNGIKFSFVVYCRVTYWGWIERLLNRELLMMCERNHIRLAMPQIVINERADMQKD